MRRVSYILAVLGAISPLWAHDLPVHPSLLQPAAVEGAVRTVPESVGKSIALRLVARDTGRPQAGLIRVWDMDGNRIACEALLPRATGLTERDFGAEMYSHLNSWFVLDREASVTLPPEKLRIEAFAGLESRMTTKIVDLREGGAERVDIPVSRFVEREALGFVAGNAHLHLQKMTADEAEDYATAVAAADQLDLAFFSYLERAEADKHYISNSFTRDDLARFTKYSGVDFSYGEEYRHNFVGNEGYGHVMFLDLWDPILPASFGPGIMKTGLDDGILRTGIHTAQEQGATVLWCHNTRGLEDIPNWLAGILDGQLFFEQDSYAPGHDGYYSYLNIGLKVPLATGTDWFFRDMAMTYVKTPRPYTDASWLDALRQGKSFMTNGPLLEFTVDGLGLGNTVVLEGAGRVTVSARARGRVDFGQIEVLRNGEVVAAAPASAKNGFFDAAMEHEVAIDQSSWLAVRIPPVDVDYNRPEREPVAFNEYGKPLFAHSSPIYVAVDGKPVFVPEAARRLRQQVKADMATIRELGQYSSAAERDRVLALYERAVETLNAQLAGIN